MPVQSRPVAKTGAANQHNRNAAPANRKPAAPATKAPAKAPAKAPVKAKPVRSQVVSNDWEASAKNADSGFARMKLMAGPNGSAGDNWCRVLSDEFGECWAHFVVVEGRKRRYNCVAPPTMHKRSEDFCPFCYASKVNGDDSFTKEYKHNWALNVLPGTVMKKRVRNKQGQIVTVDTVQLGTTPLLLEVGKKIFLQMQNFHMRGEWPAITEFNINIVRVGTTQTDTEYTVTPSRHETPIPEYDESQLNDLAAVCRPGNLQEMCDLTGLDESLFEVVEGSEPNEEGLEVSEFDGEGEQVVVYEDEASASDADGEEVVDEFSEELEEGFEEEEATEELPPPTRPRLSDKKQAQPAAKASAKSSMKAPVKPALAAAGNRKPAPAAKSSAKAKPPVQDVDDELDDLEILDDDPDGDGDVDLPF